MLQKRIRGSGGFFAKPRKMSLLEERRDVAFLPQVAVLHKGQSRGLRKM
ncbi:hypothetical protein [Solidesulfovibrio fructosivorans]|nr:hypothetical protein [Solidesulfovibrio fructosivorans]